MEGGIKTFLRGVVTGAVVILALVLVVTVLRFFYNRDKQIYEYMEQQHELETLREDYGNRDPYEFLDDPGVRGAADSGIERIKRERDEIIQRERSAGDDR